MFLARSWYSSCTASLDLGRIGKSIRPRLAMLCDELPLRFQAVARDMLVQLSQIESLPWVLTHGDVVPGNIMVSAATGRLTGFVDWAEAERLPFGICIYGLEEFLGEMTPSGFLYREDAEQLRSLFWDELKRLVPGLDEGGVLEDVKMARDLGVLLWFGIAFDDGSIDRVVEEGRDVEEVRRLDAYLDLKEKSL